MRFHTTGKRLLFAGVLAFRLMLFPTANGAAQPAMMKITAGEEIFILVLDTPRGTFIYDLYDNNKLIGTLDARDSKNSFAATGPDFAGQKAAFERAYAAKATQVPYNGPVPGDGVAPAQSPSVITPSGTLPGFQASYQNLKAEKNKMTVDITINYPTGPLKRHVALTSHFADGAAAGFGHAVGSTVGNVGRVFIGSGRNVQTGAGGINMVVDGANMDANVFNRDGTPAAGNTTFNAFLGQVKSVFVNIADELSKMPSPPEYTKALYVIGGQQAPTAPPSK